MQLVKEKEISEFNLVKLRLKIDLVSHPPRAEGLVNMVVDKFLLVGQNCHFHVKGSKGKHHVRVRPCFAFANSPGDLGSIPGQVIPKTLKMVLDASLLNTQQYKVGIKYKVEQSRERSSALPYTSV